MLNRFIRAKAWACALLMCAPVLCMAQAPQGAATDFPKSAVTLVVSSTSGGGVDIAARLLAQHLSELWGQPVVIDNRPGASGTIAASFVLRSPPNGYTLLFTASNLVQSAAQSQKPPYALSDFSAVSRIGSTNLVLVVNPDKVKARTITDLVAEIKANPGKFSFGSYGNGTSAHIYGEILKRSAGIEMTHVPYKGVAPMVNDIVAGQIPLAFADIGTVMPFLSTHRLRVLAITGTERFSGLADTPTFKERGIAGLELTGWYGLLAPARTDKAIIARLSQAVDGVLNLPNVRRTLIERGVTPIGGSADRFEREMHAEEADWTRVIRENNIRGD
jgi:tripartite-type tricarboxylate transporter receptor subunit TctC